MRGSRLGVVLLFGCLVVTAVPTGAQTAPYVSVVASGDDDALTAIQNILVRPGFVDADGDGSLTVSDPDETMYLDLDASNTVSFGDLRLTSFLNYPAGTSADYTNRDLGRSLMLARGWLGHNADGDWYFDTDDTKTVTPGDVRLTGDAGPGKVAVGDNDGGDILTPVQQQVTQAARIGWNDANGNRRLDHTDPIYVDLNVDKQATPGELRFRANGVGLDNEPTRAEFEEVVDELESSDEQIRSELESRTDDLAAELQQNDAEFHSRIDDQETAMADMKAALENKDRWLLVLGIVDLIAIGIVGWMVWSMKKKPAA